MKPCNMAYLLALFIERPLRGFDPVELFRLRWAGGGFQVQLNGDLFQVTYGLGGFDVVALSDGLRHRTEASERLQAHLATLHQASTNR